ncbi:hypothetical protein ACFXG1_05255 [Streptomyces sp. NPDC059248]|uniref:hypothetical protein n=1 Tax=Streptomyces sp. NPDC059248 TaxID=3346791 RepID=UPI00368EB670
MRQATMLKRLFTIAATGIVGCAPATGSAVATVPTLRGYPEMSGHSTPTVAG